MWQKAARAWMFIPRAPNSSEKLHELVASTCSQLYSCYFDLIKIFLPGSPRGSGPGRRVGAARRASVSLRGCGGTLVS